MTVTLDEITAMTLKLHKARLRDRAEQIIEHMEDHAAYAAGTLAPERLPIFLARVVDGALS